MNLYIYYLYDIYTYLRRCRVMQYYGHRAGRRLEGPFIYYIGRKGSIRAKKQIQQHTKNRVKSTTVVLWFLGGQLTRLALFPSPLFDPLQLEGGCKSKINLCTRRFTFLVVEYNIILEVIHHPRVSLKFKHINIILQYAFLYCYRYLWILRPKII